MNEKHLTMIKALARNSASRRDFLKYAGLSTAALAAWPVFAEDDPAGPPKRGGHLRIGASGGASSDTLDAHNSLTNTDMPRAAQLYDPLVRLDRSGAPSLVLAEEITPNALGTEWTIRLREGVTTHAGKDFTANDVLFSFQRILENKFPGATSLGDIDLANAKVMDPRTLRIPFKSPYAIFKSALTVPFFYMVPEGYDPMKPDGTGPFKLSSFTPGVQSVVERFDGYWDGQGAYLDSVETINMADEATQVNALRAGQVDMIDYLSYASVGVLRAAGAKVVIAKSGGWTPITMRVDSAPLSDVRVRQALRLLVDRNQMNQILFGGEGVIGNDVFSIFDTMYDKSLPQRERDVDQAKSLLKQAGQSDLQIELITNDVYASQPRTAQIYAAQAKEAGVDVKVSFQTGSQYFAQSYLQVPFSQDWWYYVPYLVTASQATAAGAPFNATHFSDAEYDRLFKEAVATTDIAKQTELAMAMQRIDYDRGGNIIPFFYPQIDACSPKVGGLGQAVSGLAMDNFNFKGFWINS
ncbi:MAG: ABC transporter substrate-binding protein [Pseudomonadota bacterium]